MSTDKDSERVITIPVTKPDMTVTLADPMYASVTVSTASHAVTTHECRITGIADGEVRLHFRDVFLVLSRDDWNHLASTVAQIKVPA